MASKVAPDEPRRLNDLGALVRDTVREALRSWRLPAALFLGLGLGALERFITGRVMGFMWGPVAALYTLLLGPLPWRALVPLEEDGRRAEKLMRWLIAAGVATLLFAGLFGLYLSIAEASAYLLEDAHGRMREAWVSYLLFVIGGWGLARDIQLEQRLDRTLGSHRALSAELAAARGDLLRADLDPHFLFNALNAIASQCSAAPEAERNIVRLASLLRAVLDTRRRPLHPLDDELSLARDYVGLLQARYPALRVEWRIDEASRDAEVPPLVLQPLLENAVRHGRIETGEPITVEARGHDTDLVLTVTSPGPFRGEREGGMGVDLVRRRVALAWNLDGALTLATHADRTVATITARGALPGDALHP
ncbi:MAG: histidine kinase [Myxococcales bacterium]|nr:histidine kinase [Myxococcales bacterium]